MNALHTISYGGGVQSTALLALAAQGDKACALEARLSEKADAPRYLTRYGVPLAKAIPEGVDMLPFDDSDGSCMSGACAT